VLIEIFCEINNKSKIVDRHKIIIYLYLSIKKNMFLNFCKINIECVFCLYILIDVILVSKYVIDI
jgi:hypothetical protein